MIVLLYNYSQHVLHRVNPTRSKIHQRVIEGYVVIDDVKLYGVAIRVPGNPKNLRSFIIDDTVKRKQQVKENKYAHATEIDLSLAFSSFHNATIYGGD